MINTIKKLFGFNEFEIEILCSDQLDLDAKMIHGAIKLKSNKDNILYKLEKQLIETYKKGRNTNHAENDFVWAIDASSMDVFLPANQFVVVPFTLSFEPILSNMDKLGNNRLLSAPVKLAKMIQGIKSSIRLDIKCCIRGVDNSPSVRKILSI